MVVGAVFVIVPPLLPAAVRPWTFGFVWLGFVLLLDPLNARAGRPSFLAAWRAGDRAFVRRWLVAGLVCGVLWEFWNYWALARWRYVGVPVFPSVRLFEMPLVGYLGFPPFALEVFAMYHFVRPLVGLSDARGPGPDSAATDPIPTDATRGGQRDRGEEDREALRDEEGGEQDRPRRLRAPRQGCEDREADEARCQGEAGRPPQPAPRSEPPRRRGPPRRGRAQPRRARRAPARRDPAEQAQPSGSLALRGEGPRAGESAPRSWSS